MNKVQLEDLADRQKHLLIKKGKNVDELKKVWREKWNLEYPYWKNCAGEIKKVGD